MLAGKLGMVFEIGEEPRLQVTPATGRKYSDLPLPLVMPADGETLQLLTASHPSYLNSQILPGMEGGLQVIHINPGDAKALGIASGDRVRVKGPAGGFEADAELTDRIVSGAVMCWKNIRMKEGVCNSAIRNRTTDVGSGLDYYSSFVTVEGVTP
jgi:anaerobic selenocysteine-containing dehydrogenase